MFSVRIVSTDHYMSAPIRGLDVHYADQRSSEVKKVPVVRIFGSTPAGQKTCMHVHGVFPYLYIPYDGTVPLDRYLRQFASSLDKAINVALGHGQSKNQHVYKIVLVTGRAMYGYHDKEQQFLKIYFYSPSMIKKAADLLLGGAVLNKPFQPHEAHIPYTLQLFIDYNLYGMNMINVAAVKFRRNGEPVDEVILGSQSSDEGFNSNLQSPQSFTALLNRSGCMTPSQQIWQLENIPSELYLDGVDRLSTCTLEVDVVAADIINRLEVGANIGTNPGLAALWEDEKQRCRERGETTEIAPPTSQERQDIVSSESEVMLLERLQEILISLQPYVDSQPDTDLSQESDFPSLQASQLDLHLSQVEEDDSQGTVIVEEDEEDNVAVVDVESIKKVVSFSQSFSNVKPDLVKVSSDDKCLIDILASLADQNSPTSSQNAATNLVALEEQDSILSQLSQNKNDQLNNDGDGGDNDDEILEMSQPVWNDDENKKEESIVKYDISGMDDTWIESQDDDNISNVKSDDENKSDNDNIIDDIDSDADSDIIPQFDGPMDEKVGRGRGDTKQALLKRLGMRGPAGIIHGNNRGGMNQYESRGHVQATNPFADEPSHSLGYNPGVMPPQYGNGRGWNPAGNQPWMRNMESNYGGVQPPGAMNPGIQPPVRNYHSMQHSLRPGSQYGQSPGIPRSPYQSTNPYSPTPRTQLNSATDTAAFNQAYGGSSFSSSSVGNQRSPTYGTKVLQSPSNQFSPQSEGAPFDPTLMQSFSGSTKGHQMRLGQRDEAREESHHFDMASSQVSPESYQRYQRQIHGSSMLSPTIEQSVEPISPHSETRNFPHAHSPVCHSSHLLHTAGQSSQATVNQRLLEASNNVIQPQSRPSRFDNTQNRTQQLFQNPSSQHYQTPDPPSYRSTESRSNPQLSDLSAVFSRTNQMSALQTDELSIANENSQSMSHNFVRANTMPQHQSPHSYASSVASSQDIGYNQPYQSNRLKNAQQGFTSMPLSVAQLNSAMTSSQYSGRGSLSVSSPNRDPLDDIKVGFPAVSCDSSCVVPQSSVSYSVASSVGQSGVDSQTVMSNILMQRLQKSDKPMAKKSGYSSDIFGSIGGDNQDINPLSGSFVPRTLSPFSSTQSLSSPSSTVTQSYVKTSESIVGPVTKYYQKKLMYEQISPPATPSSNADDASMKSLFSPSPSSNASESHISPLQKLLLEPSNASSDKVEQDMASPDKGPMSNVSSHSSEKTSNTAQGNLTSPGSVRNHDTSRLFNLLSAGKEMSSRAEISPVKRSENLNSSQLDLFADSLISDVGSADNSNTADSLSSLFSDNVPVTPIAQTPGEVTADVYLNNSIHSSNVPKDNLPSLSSLENFVGSVRNESSEFGVNFHKTLMTKRISNNSDMTRADMNVSSFHSFDHRRLSLDNSQNNIQNSVQNFNMPDMVQYAQPNSMPRISRGGPTRRRGRPSLKKSMSTPVETFGPVQKKRRGRPRKNPTPPVTMPTVSMSPVTMPTPTFYPPNTYQVPSHQYPPPFMNSPMNSPPMNSPNFMSSPQELVFHQPPGTSSHNPAMNMHYYNRQQSFSELLEGDGSDLLAEFTSDPGLIDNNSRPDNQLDNNPSALPESQLSTDLFTAEPQNNDFNKPLSNTLNAENTSIVQETLSAQLLCNELPNEAPPCVNYETTAFPVHQELTTINLSEAINISEPPANFDTEYILPKHPSSYDFEENDKLTASLDKTNEGFKHSLSKAFKRKNFLGPKSKNRKLKVEEEPQDNSSIMELIRYRQRSISPPKNSPAYTFRFKVPSPLYKKIKFRVKNLPQTTEVNKEQFVRMHPKDARKYSLLKIGHEIIQLSNLSDELIDDIRNNLKDGVFVDGIPPPIRSVEIQQSTSIIADLLSVDSPASEDTTEREKMDDVPISSTCSQVIDVLKEPTYVMQKQLAESVDKEIKERKPNNVCRGRGIYIPHLKKYRAGFPYFGKGNVGRGRLPAKVRPNKNGLQPEYEDDGDVVLKDVSLNDASEGTLTPIKSRTPVAGRSPAHYVGNVPDLEQSEKEILESYDLDLNQSANSQMFQDELFGSKDVQKPEDENASEDCNKVADKVIDGTENTEHINCESSIENNSSPSDPGNNAVNDDLKQKTNSDDSEMSDIIAENTDVVVKLVKQNNPGIAEKENSHIQEFANEEMNIAYGKFKKHFERKMVMFRSMNAKANDQNAVQKPVEQLVEKAVENHIVKNDVNEIAIKTEESNSDVSNSVSNINVSDKESVTMNGELKSNGDSEIVKADPIVEERIVLKIDNSSKKRKQNSSNISSGSRRKSRTSSLESNKKSRVRSSNKKPRYDSDSDGIPGVDYIVTNRFKGHKELRVVVSKLNIDEDEEIKCVSVNSKTDAIETNDEEVDTIVSKTDYENLNSVALKDNDNGKPVKPLNGFSAEFEKFLASQVNNQSVPVDSDIEECDNNDNEIGKCDVGDDKDKEQLFVESKKNFVDKTDNNSCDNKELGVVNGTVSGDEPVSQDENSCKDLFTSCDASNQSHDASNKLEDTDIEVKNKVEVLPRRFEPEGMLDFSSSSEDEIPVKQQNTRPKNLSGKSGKKKKTTKSIHDGSVFCSKARKRRPRPKSKSTKLMCTLSILHDATMEKLTSKSVLSDAELGTSSSNQSPVKSRDISDVDSPIRYQPRMKTPDFELYADKTNDFDTCYEDTMYKLAYLSPASSDKCSDSPPRPLSPKEMLKLDGTVEQVSEKSDHVEQRLTFADILKTMHGDVDSNTTDTDGSKPADTNGLTSKIAVAKTETLTLKDIKSLCQVEKDEESNDKKEDMEDEEKPMDSPPPDLGPPVLESSTNQEEFYDNSPPPQLTPNRSVNENCFDQAFKTDRGTPKTECNQSNPPFLVPCMSPRISTSPTKFMSVKRLEAEDISSEVDNARKKAEKEKIIESHKKMPACSSSGSINVIHSEEFSDISESEDESNIGRNNNDQLGKPKYTNSPTMPCLSPRLKPDVKGMFIDKEEDEEKQQKLVEIREFEERLKRADLEKSRKSDENRNNIFELMSMPSCNVWNNEGIGQHVANQDYHDRDDLNHKVSNWKQIQGTNPGIIKFKERLKSSLNSVNDSYDGKFHWGSKSSTPPRNGDKDYEQSQSASKLLYDMSHNHTNTKHHGKNGELDLSWTERNIINGEFKPSLTQNDYMLHLNRRHSSAEDLMQCSMELNYAALDRTENGKHSTSHRNFFNSFYTQQKSKTSQIGVNSGDLFESSSDISSVGCDKQLSTFHRSLSDSARTDYSIIRCNKLNDSIMKSVHNISSRQKPKLEFSHGYVDSVPFNELGSRDGKKSSNTKPSGDSRTNTIQESGRSGFTPYRDPNIPDGFEHRRGDNGHRHNTMYGSNNRDVCNVITPITGPPSLEKILQTANQHGLGAYRQTSAFYSNYRDMPEKPREGGGLLNSVQTTLVKDLEEFDSTISSGIKHWRRILCTQDSVLSSQTGTSDLLDKLDEEPVLKYAITGDQSVIITPCNLPPSFKSVAKWNIGRKLYQSAINQAKQKEIKNNYVDKCKEKVSDKKMVEKNDKEKLEKNEENIKAISKTEDIIDDPDNYRLNLFTGKRELVSETAYTKIIDKDELKLEDIVEIRTDKNENQDMVKNRDTDIDTNLISQKELENVDNLSQKSQEILRSPVNVGDKDVDVLHSTPMLRRGSTDLFEPDCTPISSTGKRSADSQEDNTGSFVTPKRIRPLRRLSTNTDTQLRRVILTSQMKLQYGSPGLPRVDSSQIEGPSLKNSFGFKHSQQNLQDAKALHEFQHLTVISVEIHAESRGDLKPDPEFDAIQAIFYSILNDVNPNSGIRHETGVFIVDPASANQNKDDSIAFEPSTNQKDGNKKKQQDPEPGPSGAPDDLNEGGRSKATLLQKSGIQGLNVTYVTDENELFKSFIDFIHRWDPDILVGYEIQMLSWGYLIHRAATLNINLSHAISRIPSAKGSSYHSVEKDEYEASHMSEIHIAGRIVLNLWRLLRHEVTLNVCSLENVMFHVLHRRVPLYPFRNLTSWFKHRTHLHRWKVIDYYKTRAKANLELMDQLDIVGRTSEFARVFGIEFYHVLSRGSQYRVESMMLRIAKPMNYIPASPSVQQRARMKAPECIPLTLEPESRFYTDPVIILDFQSLYPSIMIAYNYCFSSCLGRLEWFQKAHEGPITFGCTSLEIEPSVIQKLSDQVSVSPNGVVFCKQSVKRGVLPIMVEEILNTRLMVKKAMSKYKDDKTLSRMLNARQLGLKLIANVTYGYTGANFSGRMPCIEVGDSIVRKARETLERSIKLVEDTPHWGARVVYGDTDSMFIELKGKSKDEAFKIGQDIAKTVTAMFPKPIKLKFEKVYLPCVLQTKKRYVGFMYETPEQKEPVYDAKGIETVRRDSCSAVSKILERSIKVLFTTKDVSQVKSYVQQQCQKILEGNVSLQDFIFAKEYRGMPGYKPGACVPALEIAKKQLRQDVRSEPRVGERVPYVIVYGSPGLPLIQLVRQPHELLQDPSLRLNSTYYISKQILPPLDRFLSLMGVNVFSWYQDIPHSTGRIIAHTAGPGQTKKGTISQYFSTSNCPICDTQSKHPVCTNCMKDPQYVCVTLNDRIRQWEKVVENVHKICGTCVGTSDISTIKACHTLDCPVQYRRSRAHADINLANNYRDILSKIFQ